MSEPFEIPDRGVVAYQTFEIAGGEFPEDRWVQAAEIRPGNRSVVHHLVLFYHPPGSDEVDPSETLVNMLVGYGPGIPPTIYSPAACRRIPAGSKLMVQAHYTPNGSTQFDQSEIGLVFAAYQRGEEGSLGRGGDQSPVHDSGGCQGSRRFTPYTSSSKTRCCSP